MMLLSNPEVGLPMAARKKLDRDLRAIGLWFLMPRARRVADADVDATRSALKKLNRLSRDIVSPLQDVLDVIGQSVAEELEKDPAWRDGEFNFDHAAIRQFFQSLPGVSERLTLKVEAQRKGRRTNFVLDHSVTLAAAAFERAGLSVGPRGQSATRPSARLTGAGSRLFVAYFRQLDTHLSETTLALAMLRCRKRTRTVRT